MPNARTHDLISVVTAGGGNLAYFLLTPQPDANVAAIFTVTYLFAGYACAGDLDLDSAQYRRWGPLRFLWWPYQKFVPHRSWISHGLILGGVIRVLYLAVVCTGLCWLGLWLYGRFMPDVNASAFTRAQWESLLNFAQARPYWTGAFLSGFILAGTTHSVADILSTWYKRRF